MSRIKHFIPILICSSLIGICLSGCSCNSGKNTENESMEASWKQYSDTPITLDWYINYSWFITEWGGNVVSDAITEKTGVSINFITPKGNESEKINALIASNALPDIVTLGWWEPQVDEIIEKGLVYPLNELSEQYEPYFMRFANSEVVEWYTKEDGNLYCYPNCYYTLTDYENSKEIGGNHTFLVRKDLYEAIGSPDMTTPEGFSNAIRRVCEEFPEVDGEPLIPIGGDEFNSHGCNSFDKYLMSFLSVPYEKDGEFYDRYTDSDYIEWLKVFRQLGEEGYLKDCIFTDKRYQMNEKSEAGRYFCMLYQNSDILNQQKKLYSLYPERIFMAVDGPKNAAGDDPVIPGGGINGWTVTFISKECRDPERAISFLTYLMSEEGQKMIYLGVEGETYDMVDNQPVIKPEIEELLNTDRDTYDRLYGADGAYWMIMDKNGQRKWEQKKPAYISQLEDWTKPYTVYTGQYDIIFKFGSEEANSENNINELWGQTLPKLLLADSEEAFDRELKEFIQKREEMGFEQLMEAKTKEMNRLKQKLGIILEEE